MLHWTIYICFAGAFLMMCLPGTRVSLVRFLALLTSALALAVALMGVTKIQPRSATTLVKADWIPSLGISYYLAADGISATRNGRTSFSRFIFCCWAEFVVCS